MSFYDPPGQVIDLTEMFPRRRHLRRYLRYYAASEKEINPVSVTFYKAHIKYRDGNIITKWKLYVKEQEYEKELKSDLAKSLRNFFVDEKL